MEFIFLALVIIGVFVVIAILSRIEEAFDRAFFEDDILEVEDETLDESIQDWVDVGLIKDRS